MAVNGIATYNTNNGAILLNIVGPYGLDEGKRREEKTDPENQAQANGHGALRSRLHFEL